MIDAATFDRLAESCEDAILVRLRDFGAGGCGVLSPGERADLNRLLTRIAGPVSGPFDAADNGLDSGPDNGPDDGGGR